jgi:hypothetical protein
LAFHSGREADHSPPSSAEVKEWVELYLHSPTTPSWRGAQDEHRGNFTVYFIKTYRGAELQLHEFLTSTLGGREWSVSFIPRGKSPRYQLNGRLSGPRGRFGHGSEDTSPYP